MKRLMMITTLFLLIIFSPSHSGQEAALADVYRGESTAPQVMELPEGGAQQLEEDDDVWFDQEFFRRKLFQKNLEPLTKRQKITWSFRMAETNTFL
jgi:hypothetical protein